MNPGGLTRPSDSPPQYAEHAGEQHANAPTVPFSNHFRDHRIIGIYRATRSDLLLANSANDPSPLCYITNHSWHKPNLEVRSAGSATSRIISTVEFRAYGNTTIALPGSQLSVPVETSGYFHKQWSICIPHPVSMQRVRFDWQYSSGPEVGALEGRARGLKLVRADTGEVFAVFAYVSGMSSKKLGKMRWVADGTLGDVGDLLVMTSLLAVLEKLRRAQRRRTAAAAAAG